MPKLELETHAEYSDIWDGYFAQVRLGDDVLWESPTSVPFEHGDYDHVQQAKAERIAHDHLVARLQKLLS